MSRLQNVTEDKESIRQKIAIEITQVENKLGLGQHELFTHEYESAIECLRWAWIRLGQIIKEVKEL